MNFKSYLPENDSIPNFYAGWEDTLQTPWGSCPLLIEKEHPDHQPDSFLPIQKELSLDIGSLAKNPRFKNGFEEWAFIHYKDYSHVWPKDWSELGLGNISQSEISKYFKVHCINVPWFIQKPDDLYFYVVLDCDWMIHLESVCVISKSQSSLMCLYFGEFNIFGGINWIAEGDDFSDQYNPNGDQSPKPIFAM